MYSSEPEPEPELAPEPEPEPEPECEYEPAVPSPTSPTSLPSPRGAGGMDGDDGQCLEIGVENGDGWSRGDALKERNAWRVVGGGERWVVVSGG